MNNTMNNFVDEQEEHHHNPPVGCNLNGVTSTTILKEVKSLQHQLTMFEKKVEKIENQVEKNGYHVEQTIKLIHHFLQKHDLPSYSSSSPHHAESSVSRSFRLCFKNKMPDTILTKHNIEDQGASLELHLCDDTGERLEEVDPEIQNLKVIISALDGFKFDDNDNFTVEDFHRHPAIKSKGKPPLLKGDYEISLINGFARVRGISFTDDSSAMLDGKLKLGAQVIKGLPFGSIVRPAVTEAFKVQHHSPKDGQNYLNPSPNDDGDISRLINKTKNGKRYQRLEKDNAPLQLQAQEAEQRGPMKKRRQEQALENSLCFPNPRPVPCQEEPSKHRPLKLVFDEKFISKVFADNKVVSEKNVAGVGIMLVQTSSQEVITGSAPVLSKTVDLVVIDGKFDAEGRKDWTKEDFSNHILSARKDKRPLLVGECQITLDKGMGIVSDVRFTDNSSWVSTKKFRLGARMVGEEDQVMEAVSNPIRAKDQRGQKTQKREILHPEDGVWRVEGIAKEGRFHQRLQDGGIHNVKDLVALYQTDKSSLSKILQISTSHKYWETISNHVTSTLSYEQGIQMSEMQAGEQSQPQLDSFRAMLNNDIPSMEDFLNDFDFDV